MVSSAALYALKCERPQHGLSKGHSGRVSSRYGTPEEDGLAQRMFGEVFAQA